MEFDKLTDDEKIQVAKGFDATPELIPFIPYLLQDLWELGSSPHIIIDILKSLKLSTKSVILDLACGKGAVSIQIARALNVHCYGIDLFKPFILEAIRNAQKFNVSDLCKFEVESIQNAVKTKKNYEVVILASAENLLGNLDDAIKALRRCIVTGGYIIFDGSYRKDTSSLTNPDYSIIKTYDETMRSLKSCGDKLISEIKIPITETIEINKSYTELINKRADELSAKFPDQREMLMNYVKRQEEECEIIENELIGCVWCLQKN